MYVELCLEVPIRTCLMQYLCEDPSSMNHQGWKPFTITLIHIDIGGDPSIPLGAPPSFLSFFLVSLIIAQCTIFSSFSGPKLPEMF